MKLAGKDFEVLVVPLPPGLDPADAPEDFGQRLSGAVPLVRYWIEAEVDRAGEDKGAAYKQGQEILGEFPDSPERQEAARFLADRLGLSRDLQAGLAPGARASTGTVSPRVLEAGDRRERDALAACVAYPELVEVLSELTPEHLDSELHRSLRAHLVEGTPAGPELLRLLAELDARAAAEGIDLETGKQLLLRLRERALERELQEADFDKTKELQAALAKVRDAVREFA